MSNEEQSNGDPRDERARTITKWSIGIAAVFVGLAIIVAVASWWVSGDTAAAGPRGDFFGGHLGAGAALAGTVLFFGALLLQSHELALQRREIRAAKNVARQQTEALREQRDELKEQNANLREQIEQTEDRNEMDWFLSMADRILRIQNIPKSPYKPAGLALRYVFDIADRNPGRAMELLRVLIGCCLRMDSKTWVTVFKPVVSKLQRKHVTDVGSTVDWPLGGFAAEVLAELEQVEKD